jgi:uncharacterized membrane protein
MKKGSLSSWQTLGSLDFLLLAAIAMATLLRIVSLQAHEFWYDEVLSLLLSTGQKSAYEHPDSVPVALSTYTSLLSLPVENSLTDVLGTLKGLLQGIAGGEPHPPLFFLSQHFWLRLFGNGVNQVRSLGVLLSLVAIGSSYGLGRVVLGHRGGLILAALLATNPFYLFHALNVRMYGPIVLWVTLSGWAMLQLIEQTTQTQLSKEERTPDHLRSQILWSLLLIGSVAAGFLTFYTFLYWIISLGALALYLDRRRWWLHGLRLAAGIALTTPWVLWGTRQQMRNADLDRFSSTMLAVEALGKHLQNMLQTFGVHLIAGDWVTALPEGAIFPVGLVAIALFITCAVGLWRQGERQVLIVALILGILPLALASGADLASSKFTVGWGYSRSVIFILPGCLLLLAAWLQQAGHWRNGAIAAVLILYFGLSFGDVNFRHREMFHAINAQLQQSPDTPTLVVMNSKAWGHVLRLAYYTDSKMPVKLLAAAPAELVPALQQVLATDTSFDRLLWLDPERAVWGEPKTDAERQQIHQDIQQALQTRYQLLSTESLAGTMDLDRFNLSLYQQTPAL